MSFKVLLPLAVGGESEKYPQRFRELGAEFLQRHCSSDDEFISAARDVDAIITVGSIRSVPRTVIENLERCRIVCNTQIGYDSIDVDAATERGILVTNVPGYCTEEVSDHAMALLLACARRIVQLNDAARRGQWGLSADATEVQSRIWPGLSRLRGQTLGLLGLGQVGRAVAARARGFGLSVIACDPYVPEDIASQVGVELVDQERLFRESDFLSIHAALTPETRHIMDARAFGQMKSSACLINTARGGFVDETALCQALREGKIAMAALDVTETEPPGPQSPLLGMDNVIITAHSAFFSPHSEAERWYRPTEEVARVMRGQWPKALVNPRAREKHVARWGPMTETD